MRGYDLVRLDAPPGTIRDPFGLICELSKSRSVLNVGAAGGVRGYLPHQPSIWLHARLLSVASELVGVDIDSDGIEYASYHGYHIHDANCENMNLGRKFDVIVLSDVLEHVNAPVTALGNLINHLQPGGTLIVTTPNASASNILLRALLRKPPNVYWDHVAAYLPEHVQAICDRLGCKLKGVYFFDHFDRRAFALRVKSTLFQLTTRISPRMASSFLAVIQRV